MTEYPVHGKYANGPALVDDADAQLLEEKGVRLNAKPNGYAYFWVPTEDGNTKNVYLHRFITGHPTGMDVDHVDGDKRNNTRANLRVCSRSENMANLKRSGKGVYFVDGKWHARAMKDHQNHWIGSFSSREEAIEAYNAKAAELWGDFAKEAW